MLGEGWQGLTVKAVFQPCGVAVVVPDGGGVISVPWEATQSVIAYPKGRIVFEGVMDGRVLISTDIPYAVGSHSDTEGSNSQPPTPSEWEQYVDEVKGDADRAAQAAADAEAAAQAAADAEAAAEAAAQAAADAGTQAVTDIGNAKDNALEAIDKAREEAAGSIAADVEGAKQAAAQAEKSAADAKQAAKDATTTLANVQAAGKSALDDIATERQNALSDIQNEGAKQQSAVAGAGTAALEAIGQTEQAAINQVKQAGETQAAAVQSAGTTQVGLINNAGAAQVQAVKDAGAAQVQAVKDEGEAQTSALDDAAAAHKTELESIASHPPQPNTETGKWQVWNAETGTYQDTDAVYQGGYYTPSVSDDGELTWQGSLPEMPAIPGANIKGPKGDKGDPGLGVPTPATSGAEKVPTVNAAGTGYELTGPYAPLSAAIIETVKGNPAVCNDGVAWGFQGLKVYGKSTQVVSTGAQLLPNEQIEEKTVNGVTFSLVGNGAYHVYGTATADATAFSFEKVFDLLPGTYTMSVNPEIDTSKMKICLVDRKGISYVDIKGSTKKATQEIKSAIQVTLLLRVYAGLTVDYTVYPMLVEGSTAKPWEPYTEGKPAPSPEYPQTIVSAGASGSIALSITDSANQSQSLTLSTPNGLPGIPVDSGGNYTDAEGQQSACDVKDYGTGKYTQMVGHIESYNGENITTPYMSTTGQLSTGAEIYYVLDEPVVTDISAEELAAYRALHTYDGVTMVSTAEDVAGLEVKYVADAQKYIDDRLTAAEQRIQELAAAQLNAQTGG